MTTVNWGLLASGIGALAVILTIALLLIATDGGIFLVAFFPLVIGFGGALILAGRDGS